MTLSGQSLRKTLSVHPSGVCTEDHWLQRCPLLVQPVPLCVDSIQISSNPVKFAPVLCTSDPPVHPVLLGFAGPRVQFPYSPSRAPHVSYPSTRRLPPRETVVAQAPPVHPPPLSQASTPRRRVSTLHPAAAPLRLRRRSIVLRARASVASPRPRRRQTLALLP